MGDVERDRKRLVPLDFACLSLIDSCSKREDSGPLMDRSEAVAGRRWPPFVLKIDDLSEPVSTANCSLSAPLRRLGEDLSMGASSFKIDSTVCATNAI